MANYAVLKLPLEGFAEQLGFTGRTGASPFGVWKSGQRTRIMLMPQLARA